jgi:hypothetical protein
MGPDFAIQIEVSADKDIAKACDFRFPLVIAC